MTQYSRISQVLKKKIRVFKESRALKNRKILRIPDFHVVYEPCQPFVKIAVSRKIKLQKQHRFRFSL